MPILVTGATSLIGFCVCHALRDSGAPVRVPLSAAEQRQAAAEALRVLGCEVVEADLREPASLPRHFFKVERVFLHVPLSAEAARVERQLLDVARDTSKPEVVKLSSPGAAPNGSALGQVHYEGETALRESGLRWTVLQPASLMQNFLLLRSAIDAGEMPLPLDEAAVNFIDLRDVVRVAVKVLTNRGHHERIYPLTGREALTGHEIARIFSSVLDRPVVYRNLDEEQTAAALQGTGFDPWLRESLKELYARYRDGWGDRTTDTVSRITNRDPHRFADFVREYFAPQGQGG